MSEGKFLGSIYSRITDPGFYHRYTEKVLSLLNRTFFRGSAPPMTVSGFRMSAHSFDRYLALWSWRFDFKESYKIRLLRQYCQPGSAALDIGANIGYFSLLLSSFAAGRGHVWAFEPAPDNFAMLLKNIKANRRGNITPVRAAVGAKTGQQFLYLSSAHSGDHRVYQPREGPRPAVPVDFVALDDYFSSNRRIDLIKMDIQGAEGLALKGMPRILSQSPRPIILMECWPHGLQGAGSKVTDVLFQLSRRGYRLHWLDESRSTLMPVALEPAFDRFVRRKQYVTIFAR
ncbi:MAG: FkbM family methyltransferase [Deltaproteobacteria bacterium]|nr:FkbM family methyltransferase [Deltaproteobacteria bacterium]